MSNITTKTLVSSALFLLLSIGKCFAGADACQSGTFVLVVDQQTTTTQTNATYVVGGATTYSINCAPANSKILWSSTLNGVSTGENNVYYGQNTNSNGYWSGAGGAWATANLGNWTKTASINGITVTVSFIVTPNLTVTATSPNTLVPAVGGGGPATFTDGQQTTYSITGAPPNSEIYWSSTKDGYTTGENHVYYGQNTNSSGSWSGAGGAWSAGMEGAWTKMASIGTAPLATASFEVISSCTLFSPSSHSTPSYYFNSHVGVYDWPTNNCEIGNASAQLASLGAHVIRIILSDCPKQGLATLLTNPYISQALNSPYLTTFVLTVEDSTTCGTNSKTYVDPTQYPGGTNSSVYADYEGLTEALYSTYHGTNKTFIIDNWEGDNAVYCGYAYGYATSQAYRDACNANYSVWYKGVPSPTTTSTVPYASTAMQGFTDWLSTRDQGIQAGKSWAASNNLTSGITVSYAIEFNIIHALQDPANYDNTNKNTDAVSCSYASLFNSVLCNSLPAVAHDYESYSAYESTNWGSVQTANDLKSLSSVVGNTKIIIGEFNESSPPSSTQEQQATENTYCIINAALTSNVVPYVFQWVMIDNEAYNTSQAMFDQDGLYDYAGAASWLESYYQTSFPYTSTTSINNPYPSLGCS